MLKLQTIFQLLLWTVCLTGQETAKLQLTGKPEKIESEIVAAKDTNGRFCAGIQVISSLDGFSYDSYNGVVKVDDKPGKDLVYLPPDERVLEIFKSGYAPLKLILNEIGINLQSKQVWRITISGDKQLDKLPIVIITRPDGARVFIDGDDRGRSKQQTVTIGSHQLRLVKAGYEPVIRTVDVNAKNTLFEFTLKEIVEVFVEGGSFQMGSNDGYDNEKPVHTVTVNSFYMSKYEVTQKEWRQVMSSNPSNFTGDNRPVEKVSWFDAVEYCNKKSLLEGLTPAYKISGKNVTCDFSANGYRLPTEAEWEFAARGGKQSRGYKYAGGDDAKQVGWYSGNSGGGTHPVGQKLANELGLYDLSGNVYEWCWDWYDKGYYKNSPLQNPRGASSGSRRVVRGGCWGYYSFSTRPVPRHSSNPTSTYDFYGFRLVRTF